MTPVTRQGPEPLTYGGASGASCCCAQTFPSPVRSELLSQSSSGATRRSGSWRGLRGEWCELGFSAPFLAGRMILTLNDFLILPKSLLPPRNRNYDTFLIGLLRGLNTIKFLRCPTQVPEGLAHHRGSVMWWNLLVRHPGPSRGLATNWVDHPR